MAAVLAAAAACDAATARAASGSTRLVSSAEFAYTLSVPSAWVPDDKPVKTHQHEMLLAAPSSPARAKVGVTIDPVSIGRLEDFGTAEQTAERVLAVERGRDGVKTVALRGLAVESGEPSYYVIEWASTTSRGDKVFCCRYAIANRRLYVLQASAKLEAFESDAAVREELKAIVDSFKVGVL